MSFLTPTVLCSVDHGLSALYQTLIEHHNALKSLQREHKTHLENEKKLGEILDGLRRGYNPNYQDMAVLEAVRGWEEHAGLPHINEVNKEDGAAEEEKNTAEEKKDEPLEEGMWDADRLKYQLDGLLNGDYTSLLLEHDEYTRSGGEEDESSEYLLGLCKSFVILTRLPVVYDIASYLPDFALEYYDQFKDSLVSLLELLRIIPASDKASGIPSTSRILTFTYENFFIADSSRARQAFNDAENGLKKLQQEKKETEEDVSKIFDIKGFGADGEWKKLHNTCLEYDTGEYIYEACLFNEAKQKPKNGGMNYSLG